MDVLVPLAEKMLGEHGEFYPFGGVLTSDGKVEQATGYDGRERPLSKDVIALIKQGFVRGARSRKYVATALVYDTRLLKPSVEGMRDAIAVSLNHRDAFSVVVYFPYVRIGRALRRGEPIGQRGEDDIFPR